MDWFKPANLLRSSSSRLYIIYIYYSDLKEVYSQGIAWEVRDIGVIQFLYHQSTPKAYYQATQLSPINGRSGHRSSRRGRPTDGPTHRREKQEPSEQPDCACSTHKLVPNDPTKLGLPFKKQRHRLCTKHRKLNALARFDSHMLSFLQDALGALNNSKCFSIFDLRSPGQEGDSFTVI